MNVFISGGCKNGKSSYAEATAVALARDAKPLFYIATMKPQDGEDETRIARHRRNREGKGFATLEITEDIIKLKNMCDLGGTLLLDSVTALLANEMFNGGGSITSGAYMKVSAELSEVICAAKNIVIVSDYIYSDAVKYDENTEAFRRGLAYADRVCAAACETVIEVCCGIPLLYKGKMPRE